MHGETGIRVLSSLERERLFSRTAESEESREATLPLFSCRVCAIVGATDFAHHQRSALSRVRTSEVGEFSAHFERAKSGGGARIQRPVLDRVRHYLIASYRLRRRHVQQPRARLAEFVRPDQGRLRK